MITTPTTLVLGAGASAPFGFPTGWDLYADVCSDLTKPTKQFFQLMVNSGFDEKELTRFRDELFYSGKSSIDAFLEGRADEQSFMTIGKAAIAGKLIPLESDDNLFAVNIADNWYRYLWQLLAATRDQFTDNRLCIITCNYDRSLERFLLLSLKHSYGLDGAEAEELLKAVPIVHVHGQLGGCYDSSVAERSVTKSSKQITVIYEGLDTAPELVEARQSLKVSDVICFLGFGYLATNLERLRLDSLDSNIRMYGSAKNFYAGQREAVRKYFHRFNQGIQWGSDGQGVLDFLKSTPVIVR